MDPSTATSTAVIALTTPPEVALHTYLTAGAAAVHLALAIFLWLRARHWPLTRDLAALNVAAFSWHAGALGFSLSRSAAWGLLEAIGSIAVALTTIRFLVSFMGHEEKLRRTLNLYYGVGAGAILLSIAGTAWWGVAYVMRSWSWNLTFWLLFMLPVAVAVGAVILHAFIAPSANERRRSANVAVVFFIALIGGFSELTPLWAPRLPRIGPVATVIAAVLLMMQATRARILNRDLVSRDLALLLLLGGVGGAALLTVTAFLPGYAGAIVLVGAILIPALFVGGRYVLEVQTTRSERLRQLAVIGEMAATVAHEIRNPLAAIRGATQYLQTELERGGRLEDAGEFLTLIDDEVGRLNEIVEDYQYFARPRAARHESVDLGELLSSVVKLHAKALPPNLTVHQEVDPSLPRIDADPRLVRQAVINLMRNAAQAMLDGGTLSVRAYARRDARDGDCAVVEVADTGVGMTEEAVERMFQAGQSSKSEGSGLGLTVVRRVVEAHGGEIDAQSVPGRGTVLRLLLPLRETNEASAPAARTAPASTEEGA